MTFEECIKRLPDELKALGYKMSHRTYIIGENVTNYHLDDECNDCLLRIVESNKLKNVFVMHKTFIQRIGILVIVMISTI